MIKKISADELQLLRLRSAKYSNLVDKLSQVNEYLLVQRNVFGEVTLPSAIVDRMLQVFLHHINFNIFYNSQNLQTYGKKKTFRKTDKSVSCK